MDKRANPELAEMSRGDDPLNEAFEAEDSGEEESRELNGTILPREIAAEERKAVLKEMKEAKGDELMADLERIFQSSCDTPREMLMLSTTCPSFLESTHAASTAKKTAVAQTTPHQTPNEHRQRHDPKHPAK